LRLRAGSGEGELTESSEEIAEERVNKERQNILARKNAAICGAKG